ncbi:MAG: histidine phosphatase family protein [Alphaproteobacteria bacterium]|nr:histidine phosphatase family protein [Alphaproteobacteria bacterium]
MIRLYLLRHAKSSWKSDATDDFHRPLNSRGRQAAPIMGACIRDTGIEPSLILCSAATRARETLALILPLLTEDTVIRIEHGLYLADRVSLLSRLQAVPPTDTAVLLIGHNPGMQDLALSLAAEDATAAHDTLRAKYPTGALAEIVFGVTTWSAVTPGSGELVRFETPRALESERCIQAQ